MNALIENRSRRIHAGLIAVALLAAFIAILLERDAPIAPLGRPLTKVLPQRIDRGSPVATGPMTIVDKSGTVVAAGSSIAASRRFSDLYPSQSKAGRVSGVPASNYWALLIGINSYSGSTRDNIGSYQDARDLRKYLLSLGWKSDHIVLLTNGNATASMILQSIRWLASKANSSSVVVFNYAGHEKPVRSSSDGDNESRDIALWATDNRLILDGTLGKELGRVRGARMWLNFAVCRAAGFDDRGTIKTGRIATYASKESELAYEDPAVHHTVFGWFLVNEGMVQKLGDANRDGRIAVEEAYKYARPRAIKRASSRQHPVIVDKLSGGLYLRPPNPAPPPAQQQPQPDNPNCIVIICTGAVRRESF
ncbi:MAG: caspase family protein [Actinomycetota bacterium]